METTTKLTKLKYLAHKIEVETIQNLKESGLDCATNIQNAKVSIKPGKKYTKVDIGGSGKYMVDADGNIFGIKGYGVIHKGHRYGTLDTVDQFNWGGYVASRKAAAHSKLQ